jgi:hypothetical protein
LGLKKTKSHPWVFWVLPALDVVTDEDICRQAYIPDYLQLHMLSHCAEKETLDSQTYPAGTANGVWDSIFE